MRCMSERGPFISIMRSVTLSMEIRYQVTIDNMPADATRAIFSLHYFDNITARVGYLLPLHKKLQPDQHIVEFNIPSLPASPSSVRGVPRVVGP